MQYFLIVFAFIFGIVIGSFLNVVIYRTQTGESIAKGRSHCANCQHALKALDLIPILSYIFLKGRCRYCNEKISPRYMIVEAITGLCFALSISVFGIGFEFIVSITLFSFLICLSFIDIDIMEIPYWSTISVATLGIISKITDIIVYNQPIKAVIIEALVGAICISLPFAILAFFNAMGGGDVQLMAASGILLGYKIIPAALIGIVLGGIYGLIIIIKKRNSKSWTVVESNSPYKEDNIDNENKTPTEMVFGPFLSLGIVVALLWGEEIIQAYTKLL